MTSVWQYSTRNSIPNQDKDFKRLNKSALGNRATTAHMQYLHRQQSDIRIRHPSTIREQVHKNAAKVRSGSVSAARYGGSTRTDLKKLAAPKIIPSDIDDAHTYGQPLRPPTPIKAVLGNFYGEIAGYQHKVKTQTFRECDDVLRKKMLNPPKTHTRASAMANTYVN